MFQFQIPKFIVEEPKLTLSLIKCVKENSDKFRFVRLKLSRESEISNWHNCIWLSRKIVEE